MGKDFRLIVDARFLKKNPAGVARYITEITSILKTFNIEIILVSNNKIKTDLKLKKKELTFLKFIPGTIFVTLIIPILFKQKNTIFWGTCHSIPLYRLKSILTIHDLVSIAFPKTLNLKNLIMNKIFIGISIKRAKILTAVSHFTKTEIIKHFAPNKSIHVIRNSVNKKLITTDITSNENYSNYIFTLSTIEPRKNLLSLIEAFISLKEKNIYSGNLLIGGAKGWEKNEIYSYSNKRDDIIFKGYISDENLPKYYSNCDLFVYPSLYEGFGIPPLEAYLNNAKVLCTTNSEIPYLNINNCLFFDPTKDSLEEKIIEGLNFKKTNSIIYSGSWKKEAENFYNLINENIN